MMVEQLWYTWSEKGLNRSTGWQVRAASAGLADVYGQRTRSLLDHIGYDIPRGMRPVSATKANTPVSLAFTDNGVERLFVQKKYVGTDAFGRSGVYFAHLLAGISPTFLARDAIAFWHSLFWRESDELHASTMLPSLTENELFQQAGETLNAQQLSEVHAYLPFIIQAFLSLGQQQKLYIMATDEQIAKVIWGLAHSLPAKLQYDLTFSTYEQDVTKSSARVVGTCLSPTAVANSEDLPTICYSANNLALNCYSQRQSVLPTYPELTAYAHYATACFAKGNAQKLATFIAKAERLNVASVEQLLLVFKFEGTPESLSPGEVSTLLEEYPLANEFLIEESVQNVIVELAMNNQAWWKIEGKTAINQLQQIHTVSGSMERALAELAQKALQKAKRALLGTNRSLHVHALSILNTLAPVLSYQATWLSVLHDVPGELSHEPYQMYEVDSRIWLLEQWTRIDKYQPIDDTALLPWLKFASWNDLVALITRDIAYRWQKLALVLLWQNATKLPSAHVLDELKMRPVLCCDALRMLFQESHLQGRGLRFFAMLVQEHYPEKMATFFMLFKMIDSEQTTLRDALLKDAQLTSPQEVISVLERYANILISSRPSSPIVASLVAQYMLSFTLSSLDRPVDINLLLFLHKYSTSLSTHQTAISLIQCWYSIYQSLEKIDVDDRQSIQELARAISTLQLQKDTTYREKLFFRIVNDARNHTQLDEVLQQLKPITENQSAAQLLAHLAGFVGANFKRLESLETLYPYIFLTLHYAIGMHKPKSSAENFVDEVLESLLKSAPFDVLVIISHEVQTWPKELQEKWQASRARKALRSRTLFDHLGFLIQKPFASAKNITTKKTQPGISVPLTQIQKDLPSVPLVQKVPIVAARVDEDEITRERLNLVFKVKEIFVPYRIRGMNHLLAQSQSEEEWPLEEQKRLRAIDTPDQQDTLEFLIDDILIQRIIIANGYPISEEGINQCVNELLWVMPDKAMSHSKLRKDEIKSVLRIFARYHSLNRYLIDTLKADKLWHKLAEQKCSTKIERFD